MSPERITINVVGTRGFPGVQGGVEAHCENLYTRLAAVGCEVAVFTRAPYCDPQLKIYKGVNLVSIGCPKIKSLETITHSFRAVLEARRRRPDILHVHAVGPSLVIPLARLFEMKVVMTNHGPDYRRKKWGLIGKCMLRLGEALGSIFASEIICISRNIADDIEKKYGRHVNVIPNGVDIVAPSASTEALEKYSLGKGSYILSVGRFVPEKGFGDLIDAFLKAGMDNWKLVIVGAADHQDRYSRNLIKKAGISRNIILTGVLKGKLLQELYSHAGLFALPSYYEGLPITLLEALSYGLVCVVSDIPAHRSIAMPREWYFPAGNIKHLADKLRDLSRSRLSPEDRSRQIETLRQGYSWDIIAEKTLEVYRRILDR